MNGAGISDTLLAGIFAGAVLCAFISAAIASSRGASAGGYFFLGLVLGVIGIILAAVAPRPSYPPQPPGWYPDPWGHAQFRWWDGYQWGWQTG